MENNNRELKRENFCRLVCGLEVCDREMLAKDASTRTYYRITNRDGKTFIVMDDEGGRNKLKEFILIDELLSEKGIHAPKIFYKDTQDGFLLLEDLGNDTLTRLLGKEEERSLYLLATEALIKTARITEQPDFVAKLSPETVLHDIGYFVDWEFPMAAGYPLTDQQRQEFCRLVKEVMPLGYKVPDTLVLWDYHVDNVMLPPGEKECAVLDFQDALWGPLTYDIMSLVEDARREVDSKVATEMKDLFFNSLSGVSREDFDASFAFWSLFRHLRVLGRFTILMACHQKDKYLCHIPHLWNMLERSLQHPAFAKIKNWLDQNLPPALRRIPQKKPIRKAMVLAAGRGIRMGNLTDNCPKPLIKVAGKCLIDYSLDKLAVMPIEEVVVNVCYKKEMLKRHLETRKDLYIRISEEDTALETGGGIKKALPILGDEAFFSLNSDNFFLDDGIKPELWRMLDAWDDRKYDILLLLAPLENVFGDATGGIGNYRLDQNGKWERNILKVEGFPYLYSGIAIIHPRIFEQAPEGKFSLRDLFDQAAEAKRLGMVVAQSRLFQVGTASAITAAEAELSRRY